MSILFDESLKTGNELIDSQHKELIDRVNKLTEVIETSKEQQTAISTLNYLMDYTDFHFSAEEKLQEETGYPGLEAHKALHAGFIEAVKALEDMYMEDGPSPAFAAAVNKNVVEWLLNHIQVEDKKVAAHVK